MGRATIEAVLRLSAEQVAGPPHPGKKGGAIGWHGGEQGTVCLKERKLGVKRPRLGKKGEGRGGEVTPYGTSLGRRIDRREIAAIYGLTPTPPSSGSHGRRPYPAFCPRFKYSCSPSVRDLRGAGTIS